jgi:hypothetical protein
MRRGGAPVGPWVAIAALMVLAVGLGGLVGIGRAGSEATGVIAMRMQLHGFGEYRLFDAGLGVEGWPLTAIVHRDDTASFVSFIYGDCSAADDVGCAPPAEIQVWPSCRRSLGMYDGQGRPDHPVPEGANVRGVPAAFFDDGTRLELQTGRSTIVVFADTRARTLRIAAALRSLDGAIGPREPLPPPTLALPPTADTGGAMGC